jgi:type IV secretion system protein VirB1
MLDFTSLAQQCAPLVDPGTMAAIVRVESGFNPFAIGVVHGKLTRQPRNLEEAQATIRELDKGGYNYSVGLSQVNKRNFGKYGLNGSNAFDPCANLDAGSKILSDCFVGALPHSKQYQDAIRSALSCYYGGSFSSQVASGYVQKVVDSFRATTIRPIPVVPAISPAGGSSRPPPPVDPWDVARDDRSSDQKVTPKEDDQNRGGPGATDAKVF